MTQQWILVGLGGAAGSILRYGLQKLIPPQSFPYGTFAANLAGCLLIGIFWGFYQKGFIGSSGRLLLMTGFCGGFTTLSAFTLESVQLLQSGKPGFFLLYAAASIGLGLLATFCGFKMFY